MAALDVQRQSSAKSMASRPSSRPSIEYYMRPESRMSSIPKVKQNNDETRAQYAWRLIRQCVKEAVDLTLKADMKEMLLSHGIQHLKQIMHINPIQQMVYNKNTEEYITVDGTMLRVFHPDGRKKEVITPLEPFNRLIYASTVNLYVGWTYKDNVLILMNDEFEVVSKSEGEGPFLTAVYNENIGEVVTTGPGFLTSWVFRYGGRHILPRKTTKEGLTKKDKFHLMVLEETISRSQKGYAACGAAVAVFNLYQGQLLHYKKELHVRNITALLFFNPLKYLITGAKDGSIKVWDDKWHLQVVFVGHSGPVTSLALHPYGPNFMSGSTDNTIRVWSLETCDEADVCPSGDPVANLGTMVNKTVVTSHSNNHADLWKVNHIHMLHTRIGHRALKIKTTDHPEYPVRSVILCKDASVRVTSPVSGDVITTLIQNPKRRLVDAAYAISENELFACFLNGDIVKADSSTNPCTVVAEWKCQDPNLACNYLMVYEYVITADVGNDMWGGIKRIAAAKGKLATMSDSDSSVYELENPSTRSSPVPQGIESPSKLPPSQNANKTLLIGGRKDGHLCVFNMKTGETEFEIEAHGTFGVLSMIANSKADQLISAGLDNLIKIWRLFPYAKESLAPLMTLYCAHTPTSMCILKNKLAVAFQEHSSATYSVVMYSLKGRNRFDHAPADDHLDSIIGLTSCPKLKIVASASHDGNIKVWNELNNLVRVIRLNARPHSLAFCSDKGDLLVGIGDHVHKIDYKKYMPKAYRLKMLSLNFTEQVSEKAPDFDENLVNLMSKEDQKRLKAARSSFKFTHFVDILTEEESEDVMKEKNFRDAAFNSLASRDEELIKIKDGEVQATRKVKTTPATKREGFERYLKIFYNRPRIPKVHEDEFADDLAKNMVEGGLKRPEEPWKPEKEPTGFFRPPSPPRTTKRGSSMSLRRTNTQPIALPPATQPTQPTTPATPIRADGYVPNSVLAHLLFPKEKTVASIKEESTEIWRPKQLTQEQMEEAAGRKKPVFHGSTDTLKLQSEDLHSEFGDERPEKQKANLERVLIIDYSDDEDAKSKEAEDEKEEEEAEPSAFFNQMKALMDESRASTPMEQERAENIKKRSEAREQHQSPPPAGSPEVTSAALTVPGSPVNEALLPKPSKSLTRYVSTYKKAPHPPKSSESSRASESRQSKAEQLPAENKPSTPLPDVISQFKGSEWFDKYFPNANENTFPKPWSVAAFVTMVVRVLRIADYKLKSDVLDALILIHTQEGITNPEPVYKVMFSIFNHHTHPPSCMNEDEKVFIKKGLELLQILGLHDREFYIELLVQFLEGDRDIRSQVMENLQVCGLKDPQKYLTKELDSWDVWNVSEADRQGELRRMCKDWLERWMASFKIHLTDTIDRLKRGQSIVGRVTPNQVRSSPAPSGKSAANSKGILKRPSLPGLAEENEEVRSSRTPGQVNVLFEKAPDASSIENATFMEAINYFCDTELEKYVDQLKSGGRTGTKGEDDKNTVLVLPKIQGKATLVRLGETHTSKCRPSRETSLAADLKLPPVTARGHLPAPGELYGFPHCIQLPMKSVVMNPFPSELDQYDPLYSHLPPVLLMLQSSQKYFVHDRSYIPQNTYGEV